MKFERRNGILQVSFHSHGGSLKWGGPAHGEFGYAFADIGSDPENRVVIITGTGDDYCAEFEGTRPRRTPKTWDLTYWEGKRLLVNLLEIEVPIIGAVNGPALIHAEIPVMSDIVASLRERYVPGCTSLSARRGPRRRRPCDMAPAAGTKPRTLFSPHRPDLCRR